MEQDPTTPSVRTVKIVLAGSYGVGKSSLIVRLSKGTFDGEPLDSMSELTVYDYEHKGQKIKLSLPDTMGAEKIVNVTGTIYRGVDAVVFVYDVANKESFDDLNNWFAEAKCSVDLSKQKASLFLVGNKSEQSERAVTPEAITDFVNSRKIPGNRGAPDACVVCAMEVSAKTGDGVQKMIATVLDSVLGTTAAASSSKAAAAGDAGSNQGKKKKGCILLQNHL